LVSALSFQLYAGRLLWLKGANGSGKTSLMRVVAGLSQPDEGEVRWRGESLSQCTDFRSKLLFVGHQTGLKDDLTAIEALSFLSTLRGLKHSMSTLRGALALLGVLHRSNVAVRSLSQGQKKRVALARMALDPGNGIWILDEPLDALDPLAIETVLQLMRQHLDRGGCVLMTSHIPLRLEGHIPEVLTLGQSAPL
jgi:heme exporter protein A